MDCLPSPPPPLPPPPPTLPPSPPAPSPPPHPFFACLLQNAICDALADLYYATGGPQWRANIGWLNAARGVATDYCSFAGVACIFPANKDISNIVMGSNLMTGSLPASFAELDTGYLSAIDIASNRLTGAIPESLGRMTSVVVFMFYGNAFTSLPLSIGSLSRLAEFQGSANMLAGSLPATLSGLTSLTQFVLFGNQLVSSFPGFGETGILR